MLEQRRAKQKGYITLKEAAHITGYTSDYIGQLIRAGKIKGEQVYSTVAWVTTEDDLHAYLSNKGKAIQEPQRVPFFELNAFRYLLYVLIACCVVFILILQYVFYISLDSTFESKYLSNQQSLASESS